jgi:hypothetical protein
MGTNLKARNGKSVWSPPNMSDVVDIVGAIGAVFAYCFRGAAARQRRLNPSDTEVDDKGDIDVFSSGLSREEAKERGWGEIHKMSYHKSLAYFERTLNHPMLDGKPTPEWAGAMNPAFGEEIETFQRPVSGTKPSEYGALQEYPVLDNDGLAHYSEFKFPVHVVGYNWTQSNGESAKVVFSRIAEICAKYGKGTKAIVITHSMGGIVARALSQLDIPNKSSETLIHGVIHGAQPATGAPLVAKRFRTGAESLGLFFGRNDEEWTAVAASATSALELMPMPDYRNGDPWWFISDEDGKAILSLPREPGSAAADIYVNKFWYGMIPYDALIDPAGILKKTDAVTGGKISASAVFEGLMATVADFQVSIANCYHRNTYALYGDGELVAPEGPSTKAKKLLSFGTVTWKGKLPQGTTEADLLRAKLLHDDHRGTWIILVNGVTVTLKVQVPDEPGDGTVPGTSAGAQFGGDGVQAVFKQGGFEHQYCFDHPWVRWATLYAMTQIVSAIPKPI